MPLHNPYEDALANLQRLTQGIQRPKMGTEYELEPPGPLSEGGPSGEIDPSMANYVYLNQRNNELKDRLFAAQRTGDTGEASAIQGLMAANKGDIEENPIWPGIQMNRVAEIEQRKAGLQGFQNPQEMAKWGREMEMSKVMSPQKIAETEVAGRRDVAGIERAGGLERQQEASRGALDVAQTGVDQYRAVLDMLNAEKMGGNRNLRSFTLPRGGSFSFEQEPTGGTKIPAALSKQLTDAWAAKKGASVFSRRSKIDAQLAMAQEAVLRGYNTDPEVKQLFNTIRSNPKMMAAPTSSIIAAVQAKYGDTISQDELNDLSELLAVFKGPEQ